MTTTAPAKKAPKAKAKRRAQGEGSISQRKDGSWQGSFALPKGRDGATRRKYVYGSSKADVVKKMNAAKAELDKRGDLTTSHPTVAQWCTRFMRDVFQGRPGSIRNYNNAINNHITPFLGTIKLDKLTPDDVLAFHRWCRDAQGLSGTTVALNHAVLRTVLNAAVMHDFAYRNVAALVKAPKRDKPEFVAWTIEESRTFLEYLDEHKVPNAARYAFALLTGARAGETLGLRWKDVDWENGRVHIRRQLMRITQSHGCNPDGEPTCGWKQAAKCPKAFFYAPAYWEHEKLTPTAYLAPVKTESGERIIPLIPALRSLLAWHWEQTKNDPNPHGLVFTRPKAKWGGVDPDPANALPWRGQTPATERYRAATGEPVELSVDGAAWRKLAVAAGVRSMRRHDARRTAVTILLDMGVSPDVVRQIVGHSSIDMTEAYRVHSLPVTWEAMTKLSPMIPASMLTVTDAPDALTA